MPVEGIRRAGRATQGVIVMRLRGDEQVSALAPVVSGDGADDRSDDEADAPVGTADEPDFVPDLVPEATED
jgi:hypothetical protein